MLNNLQLLILFVISAHFLVFCGRDNFKGQDGVNGTSCTTVQTPTGAEVTCADGSKTDINNGSPGVPGTQGASGPQGTPGVPGEPGAQGKPGTQGTPGAEGSKGATGDKGDPGPQGPEGPAGRDGRDGLDGLNGTNGIDGKNGATGMPGTPGTIITPVIPCPTKTGAFPEVLLCIGDALYAVYIESDPHNTRYTRVPSGEYQTTDGRSCKFTVVSGCSINYN